MIKGGEAENHFLSLDPSLAQKSGWPMIKGEERDLPLMTLTTNWYNSYWPWAFKQAWINKSTK